MWRAEFLHTQVKPGETDAECKKKQGNCEKCKKKQGNCEKCQKKNKAIVRNAKKRMLKDNQKVHTQVKSGETYAECKKNKVIVRTTKKNAKRQPQGTCMSEGKH